MAEPSHLRSRLTSPWAVVLAGPVVGMAYFWLVYLLAEASCAERLDLLGTSALRIAIVASTAAAVTVVGLYAWRGRTLWRAADEDESGGPADERWQNRRFLVTTGLMLLGLFALFVLFLVGPVVGSSLC